MSEFKTLQFPNTPAGQADKVRALQRETTNGWRVVSETIVPGKFKGGQACCFFIIFAPCAFLAGHHPDIITVTLERDTSVGPTTVGAPSFDRQKWNALVQYDSDISVAADKVRPLGTRWMDEFAAGFLVLNDKSYLPSIVESILKRAEQERDERAAAAARTAEQQAAAARKKEEELAAQREQYERWRNFFWGTPERKIVTSVAATVALVVFLMWLGSLTQAPPVAPPPTSSSNTTPDSTAVVQSEPTSDTQVASSEPSFDCARVHRPVLKLVCSTPSLATLDHNLADAYSAAMTISKSPVELRQDQREWIQKRNNSAADVSTLEQIYTDRIRYLAQLKSGGNDGSPTEDSGPAAPPATDTSGISPNLSPIALMGERIGNTVISRGRTVEWHYHFEADGTFSAREVQSSYSTSGTWQVRGNDLCLTFSETVVGQPKNVCNQVEPHKIGDSWDGGAVTLVAGNQ
jgi:uncharacterized protein